MKQIYRIYKQAFGLTVRPGAPVPAWYVHGLVFVGYVLIPTLAVIRLWLVGLMVTALSIVFTSAVLRYWLPYLRGSELVAEKATWRLMFSLIFLIPSVYVVYNIWQTQPRSSLVTRDYINNGLLFMICLLASLLILLSGSRSLKKQQSHYTKRYKNNKLFQ